MTSGVILILAQIDDAPGELLAEVMDRLERLGAKNVQLLSSLTKKGRPGYVMMVDLPADKESEAAALLAEELGIWGYRVMQAKHKHFDIETFKTDIVVHFQGRPRRFALRAKRILRDGRLIHIKAEHDDLSRIGASLREEGAAPSLAVLKARIESALGEQNVESNIEIQADELTLLPSKQEG